MNIQSFMVEDILKNTLDYQKESDKQHGEKRVHNLCIAMEMASRLPGKVQRKIYGDEIKKVFFPENYEIDIHSKIEKRHERFIGEVKEENG